MKVNPISGLGSYRTIDGVRFTVRDHPTIFHLNQTSETPVRCWSSDLAEDVFANDGPNAETFPYAVGGTIHRTFDKAARAAIAKRKAKVASARELVRAYDAALGDWFVADRVADDRTIAMLVVRQSGAEVAYELPAKGAWPSDLAAVRARCQCVADYLNGKEVRS